MLQWMDDFSCYGSGTTGNAKLANGNYAQSGSGSIDADPDPSGTGALVYKFAVAITSPEPAVLRKVLDSAETTVGVAGRYWLSGLPANTSELPMYAHFRDTSNNYHGFVTVNPSGYMQAWRYTSGTTAVLIAESDTPAMIANAWRHVEIKWVFDATNGSVEVRVEGVQVINVSGINTVASTVGAVASCQNVAWWSQASGGGFHVDCYMKDLVIWDGSGSANIDFMGAVQVYKIVPDGDVSLGWTPSTGTTGWDLINEATPSDDTGYISADATPPGPSQFTMTDLPVDVTSVHGVMAMNRSRKTDGGDGNLQVSVIQGTDTSSGEDRTITTAWTYWTDRFDLAPDGGNWTKTKVDDIELKIDRTV